jgi:hypothetical protein
MNNKFQHIITAFVVIVVSYYLVGRNKISDQQHSTFLLAIVAVS